MKNSSNRIFSFFILFLVNAPVFAQSWPVTVIMENDQVVKMYAPQISAYANDQLVFRSAVSLQKKGDDDPVFGMVWAKAQTRQSGNFDRIEMQSIAITDIRFPSSVNSKTSKTIESRLELKVPDLAPPVSKKEINDAVKLDKDKLTLDQGFSNKAPRVIYRNSPSMLVLIDGDPVWQRNEEWGVEAVVNSPNTIVRNGDGNYYIYGAHRWFSAASLGGPYNAVLSTPGDFRKIESALAAADKSSNSFDADYADNASHSTVSEIIVSTEPAELIQSDGEATFSPIANTSLMYVDNSPNDIFMDVNSQQYFILLSGRWYVAKTLKGNWTNIGADQLPEDFANIPAGSEKDNVLASVAGTPAAKNALLDAQVPQTARVNRNSASATVNYDGDPEFEDITGTRLAYARNTSSPVIRYNRRYFMVDNGIWFQSSSPAGPWIASNYRPDDIDLIPPSYPVYNVKYVYIYDVTPEYIYTGYTPGYLNTYIYGPTIVYGTGYYYRPWHRRYYYPRPYTWGFNMHYTPWTGWSFGFNFYGGWFYGGYYGYNGWNNWGGGWWGPTRYRPSYCGPSYRNNGYYGLRNNHFYVNDRSRYYAPRNYYGNVYSERRDVVTRDRIANSRPGSVPNNRNNPSPPNTRPDSRTYPSREYRPQPDYRPAERSRPENRPQNRVERNPNGQRHAPQRMERNERNERPSINNRRVGG
ncbi:hypothetical protein [Flavihumibacter fluvii]|uniref:hypothetical protein n=1 Tax=Flavihumibacter fluvii TaxID=2838157 RepID=UPI001BDE904F|nr:hypothetical protein [Flavihumibacter fluvii]ULQ53791.1 hypothetical protein KJS93_05575 [Flavihumibacter fluvii]